MQLLSTFCFDFFRPRIIFFGRVGGVVGWLEKMGIKLTWLPIELKLKFKLSLAIVEKIHITRPGGVLHIRSTKNKRFSSIYITCNIIE